MAPTPLQQLTIHLPCPANWNQMQGNSQSRFCTHCQKHVHNLSNMPTEQAERLLCDSAGPVCVRFTRNAKGKIITLGYDPAKRKSWPWKLWSGVTFASALIVTLTNAIFLGGCQTTCLTGMPLPTTQPTAVSEIPVAPTAVPPPQISPK